jgi:hypothetical protein
MENLDHLLFLIFLSSLIYFGIRQIKRARFSAGITFMIYPVVYFSFAILYFLSKFVEGRSDQYVDWRDSWAIGITELLSTNNLSYIIVILILHAVVYFFARFIEWCGSRAEAAGKSKVGFMILALLFPVIAWIILLIVSPGQNKAD